jgi:hypothetical protein
VTRAYPALLDQFQRAGARMQQWLTIRTLIETFARNVTIAGVALTR